MAYTGCNGDGHDPEQLFTLGWSGGGQAILVLAKTHGLDGQTHGLAAQLRWRKTRSALNSRQRCR